MALAAKGNLDCRFKSSPLREALTFLWLLCIPQDEDFQPRESKYWKKWVTSWPDFLQFSSSLLRTLRIGHEFLNRFLGSMFNFGYSSRKESLKAWQAWQAWKHENGRIPFHWKLKNSQRRTLKREFQVRAVRNLWTFRGSDVNEVQSFAQWNVHSVEWVIPQMLCNAVFSCTAQVMKTHGSFGPCWRHSHISDLADLPPKYDRCLSPYWTLSKPNPSEIKLTKLNQIHKFHKSILI